MKERCKENNPHVSQSDITYGQVHLSALWTNGGMVAKIAAHEY